MNRIVKGNGAAARKPQGFTRSALCCAIAGGLLLAAAMPAAAQHAEAGQVGDAESWHSEEFKRDWGLAAIGADHAYARGLTGQGVMLGVFDSGSVLDHPEFAGKDHRSITMADAGCTSGNILGGAGACFYSEGDTPMISFLEYNAADKALVQALVDAGWLVPNADEILESMAGFSYDSHGTHVAGTMVANRDGSGMHGVGFGASLTTARLFGNSYSDVTSLLSDIFAIDFGGTSLGVGPGGEAVAGMYTRMAANGVRAINHSWGLVAEPTTAAGMDALYNSPGAAGYFATYINPSLEHGMLQVFAAGNGSGAIAGIYATLPRWTPELEQYWLSVVNINDSGTIDPSSSICGLSMEWCITAPGTAIYSTVLDGEIEGRTLYDDAGNAIGFEVLSEDREYGYAYYTGTSMATPHVTGALALLMERYPYLDNAQVRDVMLTTATDLGVAGVDEVYGWGLLNLEDAINGPGQIRVDTDVVMDQHAGGAKVWEGAAWDDWSNDIGGTGRLTKSGAGWLRLSGDNSFGGLTVADGVLELTGRNSLGDTVVDGGLLLVNGTHADLLTVNAGGTLGGSGTVGDTVVGGTVAPGNSIGTLDVVGDYTQAAGSYFDAELGTAGASDRIAVAGSANLLGGTVRLFGSPGEYLLGQSYTLLTADAGVDGQFAGVDSSAFSPFLAFGLDYGGNAIALNVFRGMALADAADTRNQRAVATAADAMADSDPLLLELIELFPQDAVAAFDALSGEYHASVRSMLVDSSRHVRDAALGRAVAPASPAGGADEGATAWVQAFGSGGQLDGDGNAAMLDYDGRGTLVGVDYAFAGGWRLGALGGLERNDARLPARGSEGDVRSRHLGLYAGKQWGAVDLRAGAAHARHEVDSERTVVFAGVDQYLMDEYRASTTQLFVEGGYRFGGDDWNVQPYLQVAHVQVDSDTIAETGGSVALSGGDADGDVNLATVGVRFDLGLRGSGQSASWLRWRSMLGWRHASGDVTPETRLAWTGGQAFTVAGAPVADGAALVETGVAAWLGADTLLELNYSGQFADESRDHGFNARLSYRF